MTDQQLSEQAQLLTQEFLSSLQELSDQAGSSIHASAVELALAALSRQVADAIAELDSIS